MEEIFLNLTNTAYKLLEYFPNKDPLKLKTKERVLSIMENLALEDSDKVLADIEIVLGYFEIAKKNGWINSINYLIICNEYKKLKDKVKPTIVKSVESKLENPQKVLASGLDIKLSDRQRKILEFLREKEKAQVMDLQEVLPAVTKRTIRRDLDELLSAGQIIRMGEFNQVFYKVNA